MARNKHPEQTVQKILDVSLQLFNEKGYEKTTIADIIVALGMSKGAIYHHFKSKDDIIQAICEQCYHQESMISHITSDQSLNAIEKLKKMLFSLITNEKKKDVDRLLTFDIQKNPIMFVSNMNHCLNDNAQFLEGILEEGMKDGTIEKQDSKAAAQVLMLLLNFWIYSPLSGVDEEFLIKKVKYFRFLTDRIGILLIDDKLEALTIQYFKELSKPNENDYQ
ncbi:MAG: TetR/AcrR family transcriptional regulator [Coprobacillus sp.]